MLVAAAIAVGALLFLALWIDQRNDRDFYRGGERRNEAGQMLEPLPAPPVANHDGASRAPVPVPDAPAAQSARVESPSVTPPAAPVADAGSPPGSGGTDLAPGSAPVALEAPPPRYPASALRRGESGDVLLRVEVDAEGRVADVKVVRGSGSRTLDRAAASAVRDWRFRPAQRDGRPIRALVNVPITFDSRR